MEEAPKFEVIILGLIFNPLKKEMMLVKRAKDSKWFFPGGRLQTGEDVDESLKKIIQLKTGYSIRNIGAFFSQTYEEKKEMVSIYFLTEVFDGEEKMGEGIEELKWVKVKDLEESVDIPMHKKLREFLLELV